jgi:hypothetical protein
MNSFNDEVCEYDYISHINENFSSDSTTSHKWSDELQLTLNQACASLSNEKKEHYVCAMLAQIEGVPYPSWNTPTPPLPLVCNTSPQPQLDNQTCNYWSWKNERAVQTLEMKNWRTTGTVPPGWDCWYEQTQQCLSRDCLKSSNPAKMCPKQNK